MRRLLTWIGALSLACAVLFSVARALRSDGGIWEDEYESAQAVALVAVVRRHFPSVDALDVTSRGGAVSSQAIATISHALPNVNVSTTRRVRFEDGYRIERMPTEADMGHSFDVYLSSTPLYRVWEMHVRTGDSCWYLLTLVKLRRAWHTLSMSGGCVFSTPITILDRDAQQTHAARRDP